MTIRRETMIKGLVAAALLLAVLLIIRQIRYRHAPFLMTLTLASGQTRISFSRPDRHLKSESFPVRLPLASSTVIELVDERLPVPGVTVEFCDTSLFPSRFRLAIAERSFDVMEARIVVDGVDHAWQPE